MPAAPDRIVFSAYGVTVALDVAHRCGPDRCRLPELTHSARSMLPPGAEVTDPATAAEHTIALDCEGDAFRVTDPEGDTVLHVASADALHVLDQTIRSTIAVHAPGLVFAHAGMVAVDGVALVLPGVSMAGKTTLVAELVRAGAHYGSDEYAVFDAGGLVHPFARRLSVREPTGRREVPVDELGGIAVRDPIPTGLVAALTYQPGGSWQVSAGDQAGCARALITNAVAAQVRSAEVLSVCATVARSTRFVEGVRGEAPAAAAELLAMLGDADHGGPGGLSTTGRPGDGTLRR